MNRDEIERLISDALDDPADAQLAERLQREAAADPATAELLRAAQACEARLAEVGARQPAVRFERFAERVAAAIGADRTAPTDEQLDGVLRSADEGNAARVDWGRFANRVGAALDVAADGAARSGADVRPSRRAAGHARILRFSTWAAAAAAVIAAVALRPGSPHEAPRPAEFESGLATARISALDAPGAALASIVRQPALPGAGPAPPDVAAADSPVFMIVRHAPTRGAAMDSLGSF